MKIMKVITAACTMLLAWCSPAAGQFQWTKIYDWSTYNLGLGELFFTNDSTGFAAGGNGNIGAISKTTDYGATWSPPYYVGKQLKCIYFPTDSVGYAVGANEVYKTTDAGNNWSINVIFNQDVFLGSIYFFDKDTGIAFMENTGNGQFPYFKTYDGGAWWQTIYGDTILTTDIDFPSRSTGYVGKHVIKTVDGGQSWNHIAAPTNSITAIDFISNSIGYVVGTEWGGASCNTRSRIMKTIDGGYTWDTLFTQCYSSANDVFFPTSTRGYAPFGMAGIPTVMVTRDGGQAWEASIVDTAGAAIKIFCTDSITCYVSTSYGLFKTINGGGVGIVEQSDIKGQLKVFPNPFSTSTTFEITGINEAVTLCIFDQLGREVKRIEGIAADKYELSREGLSSGFYYYSLHNREGRIASGKLIVD